MKLDELTVDAYGHTTGPLLVHVDTVKGKATADPTEIFAVYESELDGGTFDAGIAEVENLTPYYLPGGSFAGLTPGAWTSFTGVTGVFATFVRFESGSYTTYRTLGPRTQAEIAKLPSDPGSRIGRITAERSAPVATTRRRRATRPRTGRRRPTRCRGRRARARS